MIRLNITAMPILHWLIALLAVASLTLPALVQSADQVTYYHNNALGSPVAATDATGAVLWRESYLPYGQRQTYESRETDCDALGCLPVETQADEKIWYTGKYEETRVGLVYLGARWYDPEIGRFLSVDPVSYDAANYDSFNRYAYANNNPYKYVDPDGRVAHIAIGAGVGALVQGGIYAATTDNFSWSGLAREAAIGAVVGGVTAAVPGSAALLNVGNSAKIAAAGASATTIGAAGEVANQAIQGQDIDVKQAAIAGISNAAGLGFGQALAGPAKKLTTITMQGNPGLPVTSPSGKTFMVGKTPTRKFASEMGQQTVQDFAGAVTSAFVKQSTEDRD